MKILVLFLISIQSANAGFMTGLVVGHMVGSSSCPKCGDCNSISAQYDKQINDLKDENKKLTEENKLFFRKKSK